MVLLQLQNCQVSMGTIKLKVLIKVFRNRSVPFLGVHRRGTEALLCAGLAWTLASEDCLEPPGLWLRGQRQGRRSSKPAKLGLFHATHHLSS